MTKPEKIARVWHRWSWAIHISCYIVLAAVGAGTWLSTVYAYDGRLTKLEGSVPRLEKNMAYLMGHFNIKYKWENYGE